MVRSWRITKAKHAESAFDGEGARLYGSRWSTPGNRVAFASETLSLAVLEVLVHLQKSALLAAYVVFTVDCPEDLVREADRRLLPKDWRDYPAPPKAREIGDDWLRRGSSVLLGVPSAIVAHERNYLINPAHEDFSKLSITGPLPLDIDRRIFRSPR